MHTKNNFWSGFFVFIRMTDTRLFVFLEQIVAIRKLKACSLLIYFALLPCDAFLSSANFLAPFILHVLQYSLVYKGFSLHSEDVLFWKLPEKFREDKVELKEGRRKYA